jgi:hypothetical protein
MRHTTGSPRSQQGRRFESDELHYFEKTPLGKGRTGGLPRRAGLAAGRFTPKIGYPRQVDATRDPSVQPRSAATIDGAGDFVFRIDVTDMGEPGKDDTYGITMSDGYTSGQQRLQGGNVQIHKN